MWCLARFRKEPNDGVDCKLGKRMSLVIYAMSQFQGQGRFDFWLDLSIVAEVE